MKNYSCSCGIVTPSPTFVGIQEGCSGPDLLLWDCARGSTHGILRTQASPEQIRAAQDVEDAVRPKSPEMMGR